jgi:tRNA A-37 threonylcarbamoyl transferase component Bud32
MSTRRFGALRRLGDYELLRKIGSGGMAEVWMGRRAALAGASKAVAIKLLARDLLDDPQYRQMFIEEARLSMLLTNSNVVQVFDVGEIDGECFMVMEWVDGLNLSELARKMQAEGEKLTTVVAAHVVGEVLRGLAYAHGLHHDGSKATIVHRDVSPQNVLVSVSGEVKLADFGVARLAREETSGLHVKGKLRYMAPEQLRGRSREPTVDLYAVGAILHELLEGQRFRQGRDEADLYAMVLSGQVPPLQSDVPPALVRLHAGLLEPDASKRIQTAEEALELLYSWPGYRNNAVELARIVRKWIGVAAPRSGILHSEIVAAAQTAAQGREASRGVSSAAETLDAPTRAVPGGASSGAVSTAIDVVESGPMEDRGHTETRTFAETAPETEATAMIVESQPPARRSKSSIAIAGAMGLAFAFGLFGVGFPLGWWGGDDAAPAVAQVEPTAEPKAEPEPQPKAEPTAEPKAEPVAPIEPPPPPPETETETGDSEETDVATPTDLPVHDELEKTKDPTPAPKDLRPATVTFKAGNFDYVYVRVGKKELTLQPTLEIELEPGKHRVSLREEGGEWVFVQSIKVDPGKRYEVKMSKPAGLKLTKL